MTKPQAVKNIRVSARAILVAMIVASPFLLIWQWGDFTDSGYTPSMAQSFASDAARGFIRSEFLLTLAFGSFLLNAIPGAGLLTLLVAAASLVVLASFAPLFALHNRAELPLSVLFAAFAAQAFFIRGWLLFDYDVVATVLLVWSAAFAVRGGLMQNKVLLFFAGFLVAGATLARLPSVLALSLCAIPFFMRWHQPGSEHLPFWRRASIAASPALLLLAGFTVGICCALIALASAGWLGAYLEGLARLVGKSQTSGSHGLSRLASTYLLELQHLLWPWMAAALLWLLGAAVVLRQRTPRWLMYLYFGITVLAMVAHIVGHPPSFRHPFKFIVPALFVPAAIALLTVGQGVSLPVRATLFAGFCIGLAGMAGSNTGILKFAPGLLFLIPGCVAGAAEWAERRGSGFMVPWYKMAVASVVVVMLCSSAVRASSLYGASFWHDRFVHTQPVDLPLFHGLRTSREKATALETSCRALQDADPSAPLFVFGHAPLLYFATQKRPYTDKIWLADQMHAPDDVLRSLRSEREKTGVLPVIAVTDRNVLGAEGWQALDQFLQENGYVRTYDAKFPRIMNLEVYAVPSSHKTE